MIHCSQTAHTFWKKTKKQIPLLVCQVGLWDDCWTSSRRAFVYSNKCFQTYLARRQPQGGVVALCLRWKGQTLLPREIQTWPSVGCSTVINSALCVGILEKLPASAANGFVKLSNLCVCESTFVNLVLNLYFCSCSSALPVNAVLFWVAFLLQHAYSWMPGLCPSSFTSGIRGTEIFCYITQKRQVTSVFILKLHNNISLAAHETSNFLTHLAESGLCLS